MNTVRFKYKNKKYLVRIMKLNYNWFVTKYEDTIIIYLPKQDRRLIHKLIKRTLN